jgi:nitroimidazol reductase NimA-like FMN-containing flavoprotein (pyridoxamine 5'-phosphate oxidase superfamily)
MDLPNPPPPPASLKTPRTTLKRRPVRGSHERRVIDAVLDEALVCHVATVIDGSPHVLPTAHVRVDDAVYMHGAPANQLLGALATGAPLCLTVTLLDGLVFSRTAFHHSMNYRSVVLFGCGTEVSDLETKRRVLHALVEHLAPGRAHEALAPTDEELRATLVIGVPIVEGSAKVRSGPPLDGPELLAHPCWAGELPLRVVALPPRGDAHSEATQVTSSAVLQRAQACAHALAVPRD